MGGLNAAVVVDLESTDKVKGAAGPVFDGEIDRARSDTVLVSTLNHLLA